MKYEKYENIEWNVLLLDTNRLKAEQSPPADFSLPQVASVLWGLLWTYTYSVVYQWATASAALKFRPKYNRKKKRKKKQVVCNVLCVVHSRIVVPYLSVLLATNSLNWWYWLDHMVLNRWFHWSQNDHSCSKQLKCVLVPVHTRKYVEIIRSMNRTQCIFCTK